MKLPTTVDYPVIAIGDLHGRVEWLNKLVAKLEQLPEWPAAKLVFLGDLGDRTNTVRELVDRVLELLQTKPGSSCVMGNHDLALVRATGLDDRDPSEYWVKRYGDSYDHKYTFESYLRRTPDSFHYQNWQQDLVELKATMPISHRELFANLPWVVEATGHLFLHCGLSHELDCPATVQLECLRRKIWDRAVVNPKFGTKTDRLFTPDYPVWLGADRKSSRNPLPFPGKTQVSGHEYTKHPDANPVRICIDTSGGTREPLTGCLLRGPGIEPVFVFSDESV